MSEAEVEFFTLPSIEDQDYWERNLAAGVNQPEPVLKPGPNGSSPIHVETWRQFADKASETIPCLVDGLWPEGALGFIASPPKKGKTWLGLSLALAVSNGGFCFGKFHVPNTYPVLYVALEGHRAALTHRIGCLARGMGIDPDQEIPNFHLTYKPRGINIADPVWSAYLIQAAQQIGAALVVVDVLRAAALMKENSPEDFALLRAHLAPLLEEQASLAFLHHFTKLSETSKERTPAERMSGTGAMYGAMDVGIFITGSEAGARKLRVEFEARDIASPEGLGLHLTGNGSGQNGGFNYHDKAWWVVDEAPDEDDVSAPAEEIIAWLIANGGEADEVEIATAFGVAQRTISRRRPRLNALGVEIITKRGMRARYSTQKVGQGQLGRVQPQTCPTPDANNHAGLQGTLDSLDTQAVSNPESADLQDKEGWTAWTPYGRESLVSEVSPVEPDETADWADDDTPF